MILALDCALGAASAALVSPDQTISRLEPMERGHAERIALLVQDLMDAAGATFGQIDRIAVTVGPGSFTGVRVGLAYARGVALALGKPCIGVSTLEALAAAAGEGRCSGAIAHGEDMFFASYEDGREIVAPRRTSLVEARELASHGAVCGPAAALFDGLGLTLVPMDHADPVVLAGLAADRDPAQAPPNPQYLRAPDAKLPGGRTPA